MTLTWTRLDHDYDTVDWITRLPTGPIEVTSWGAIATHVLRWYNRQEQSWVISYSDAHGTQVGDSTYVATKGESEQEAQRLVNAVVSPFCVLCNERIDRKAERVRPGARITVHARCILTPSPR